MDNFRTEAPYQQQGLYSPRFEHDNCGIGAVVNINGEQSRYVVENALTIVEKLEHRAGKDAEGKTHVIVITQAQKDAIVLTSSTLSANADGESLPFVVKANVTVSAKADADWLSVSPATKGLEDKSFTIVAAANETGAARQGTVSFTSGELKQVVTISQAAKSAVNPPVGGDGEYVLVTDASELAEGDKTKTVYLPYEATNLLGSIGGIKDLFKTE